MLRLITCIAATVLAVTLPACSQQSAGEKTISVRLTFDVPAETPAVYLTGNIDALGPWKPDALLLSGDGTQRVATLSVPAGHKLEYKITLGSWAREAVGPTGIVLPNYALEVHHDLRQHHDVAGFKEDPAVYMADWKNSGVLGTLVYWPDVASGYLVEARHIEIWLPPGYDEDTDQRYPVIYMHDGQNLFDPRIANTGTDWGVDEAMMRGVGNGLHGPAIVVGAWSASNRWEEYSPWHGASQYARFLTEELMPRVNAGFRTLTGPDNTSVMGSSMGGLLSYYLVKEHPDVFGACGCVSTHFPLSDAVLGLGDDTTPYVVTDIANGDSMPDGARLFFDYGTEGLDAEYGPTHGDVRDWLLAQGLVEDREFRIQVYQGAGHNEASWRSHLGDQLAWLLGPR